MKRLLPLAIALYGAGAAAAPAMVASPAYKECTALATSNPAAALAKAEEWLKIDQGIAAQHCRAMALFGLRRFEEAGQALTAVRDALGPENLSLRVYVSHQAARAWLNAGRAEAALGELSGQISYLATIRGNNAVTAQLTSELLLDRAQLNLNYGKLADAASDLDHAVSLTPLNPDVLMERAGVFEQLGDLALARQDAQAVLKLRPGDPKAQLLLARTETKKAPVLAPIPTAEPQPAAEPAAPQQPLTLFGTPPTQATAAPVTPVTTTPTR